ncbi:MAG: hypothetical protein R3F17_00765 [Planctomycetota bacterium]
MKLSLRWAVVAGVAMANALVFGLGVAWIAPSIDQGIARGRDSYLSEVAARLRGHLNPSGEPQAEGFLRWDGWRDFEDVMLVQLPELTDPSQLGQLGLMLNPRGSWRRGVDSPSMRSWAPPGSPPARTAASKRRAGSSVRAQRRWPPVGRRVGGLARSGGAFVVVAASCRGSPFRSACSPRSRSW